MVWKVKQQPSQQNFRPPSLWGQQQRGEGILQINAVLSPIWTKYLSFGEESSPEEEMTINRNSSMYEQCCFNATSNTYCESYVSESSGYGIHPTSKGRSAFEGGRQASSLCQHLEGVDKGQLGITDCQRLPDTLCRATCTGEETKSAFLPLRAVSSDARGSFLLSRERGSNSSRQSSRVLLCPLPGSQEEWANEASYQPQNPQSMGTDTPFQDGRPDLSPRPVETERLVGKGGSEGQYQYIQTTNPTSTLL